jgi:predicted metal-binding protein
VITATAMSRSQGHETPGPPEVVVHVCVTCRQAGDMSEGESRPGARLYGSLAQALAAAPVEGVRLEPVECLSVCKRPCTVAVSSPGRWTYVYGDLDPEAAAPVILAGIRLYAGTEDGIVPWRERPEAFRRGVVARIPPSRTSSKDAAE